MLDKFTFKTANEIKEVYGIAFKYYLDEDKYIIYTTQDTIIICSPELIEEWEDSALEDKEDTFYKKVQDLYYSRFKQTFCSIASAVVREKTDVNKMFS